MFSPKVSFRVVACLRLQFYAIFQVVCNAVIVLRCVKENTWLFRIHDLPVLPNLDGLIKI